MLWTGRILSAVPILMMLMSASFKIAHPPQVVQQFVGKFGWPESILLTLAVIEISCAVLYAIPRTAVLGAVLTTGYLGGAIATHVRVEDPGFVTALVLGVLVWAGLYLRDPRFHALLPLRRS
jgi:hypothetical protein